MFGVWYFNVLFELTAVPSWRAYTNRFLPQRSLQESRSLARAPGSTHERKLWLWSSKFSIWSFHPVRTGQVADLLISSYVQAGKTRHYELGKWLRERYDGFLSSHYDPAQIHVQSSNVDRTLMSAQCNLLGLYPPVGTDKWNNDVPWQPIPVHTRPSHEDLVRSNFKVFLRWISWKYKNEV
jgi:hypothetical protein